MVIPSYTFASMQVVMVTFYINKFCLLFFNYIKYWWQCSASPFAERLDREGWPLVGVRRNYFCLTYNNSQSWRWRRSANAESLHCLQWQVHDVFLVFIDENKIIVFIPTPTIPNFATESSLQCFKCFFIVLSHNNASSENGQKTEYSPLGNRRERPFFYATYIRAINQEVLVPFPCTSNKNDLNFYEIQA